MEYMELKISMSVSVNSTWRRAITRRAISKNFDSDTSLNPAAPPSLNEATKFARESGAVDIAPHAYHGGGVKHGVYARFRVVAHY